VTAGIVRAFESEARRRGQAPLVIVLPTGMDFDHRAATGRWVYQSLVDELAASGTKLLDLGEAMAGRHHCDFFTDCSGHYNAEGYALVARIVGEHLEAR
jgi:hypothetical protein